MRKKFNDTGLCIPGRHYMADISRKIGQIMGLMEEGEYFTISRPRQFGKTTILSRLEKQFGKREDYLAISLSFEDIDTDTYQNQERFIAVFLDMLMTECEYLDATELTSLIEDHRGQVTSIPELSRFVTKLVRAILPEKAMVLLIDEVDNCSNNQLFLDFLGMLRKKYLRRNEGKDLTFQSVVLAGVHDVKTLKANIRSDDERKYNSPWNIGADFTVDLSFSPDEIGSMLRDYSQDKGILPDIPAISERLRHYTSGYPYLVSKLCKFIDEQIVPRREDRNWSVRDVDEAFRMIVLENNRKLYNLVSQVAISGASFPFVITNPVISLGHLHGILVPSGQGRCRIHNRIFEQRIYAHIMSDLLQSGYDDVNSFGGPEFHTDEGLDIRLILERFQAFMKEHYSHRDAKFLEREGRLLFLSFLRPILSGRGFDFKEPNVSEERRMDIVITCRSRRYVVELKIWHGPRYHQIGLEQLSDYLDTYSLREGYLLIYDFNKNKTYRQEEIVFRDKQIFAVWV